MDVSSLIGAFILLIFIIVALITTIEGDHKTSNILVFCVFLGIFIIFYTRKYPFLSLGKITSLIPLTSLQSKEKE